VASGFVLVGGKSSRMGRDKALLPWNGTTLAQHMAAIVAEAAGSATLIGDPAHYGDLGLPVFADRMPGHGPVSGIVTALAVSPTEWALVSGCDMPALSSAALRLLIQATAGTDCRCVVPIGPSGPEPLCAVYHRSCLPAIEKAIAGGRFRMRDLVNDLGASFFTGIDPACFANLNTPADFEAHQAASSHK
jgi:molybdopterin-guanine dinucleotide biosynthesis protein A